MENHNLQTEETIEQKFYKLREELLQKMESSSHGSFVPSVIVQTASARVEPAVIGEQISR